MKILVVCQYYYPEPFRIHEVCEELVQRGHEVCVLTGLPNYPMGVIAKEYQNGQRRDETVNGVHVIRVNETPRSEGKIGLARNYLSFVVKGSLKAMTMKKDYDVIFVYQLSPILMAIPAYVAKWFSRCKRLALYCLDLWPESLKSMNISEGSMFYKAIRTVSKIIYDRASFLSYSSRSFLDYFEDTLQLKQKNYEYIPQFADSLFDEVSPIAHDGFNYVFAGNVGMMQSVQTIIRAAGILKADNRTDMKFYIVGDGFDIDNCKNCAKELGVEDIVEFTGRKPVEEMPYYYGIADAMIVTLADIKAISYTLPGKVQSYMAAGKPIVAAANGEIPRVIAEACCGLCSPAEDADQFAKLLLDFAQSDREQMGRNAKEFYYAHFSKHNHINQIEQMLKRITDG